MRYTRHDLKQDKIAETAADAANWTAEHRSPITFSIVAVVVVLALVAGGFWFVKHQNDLASQELSKALLIYNAPVVPAGTPKEGDQVQFASAQERAIASKNAFYAISSKYGYTHAGKFAHFLAEDSEMELGNYKVAEEQLKQIAGEHDKEVAALAKLSLAGVYTAQGRDDEAIKTLKEIIDHPTVLVPKARAELVLSSVYMKKQPAAAAALFDQMIKDDPKGIGADIGEAGKRQLSQKQ